MSSDKLAKYESRIAVVKFDHKIVFNFVSDMRNFHRFIPGNTVKNWKAERDHCEFEVSPVGKAKIKLLESEPYSVVKFEGDGLNNTSFFLWVQIKEVAAGDSRVKITIKADLSPMIRTMASKPILDFLEKLVVGMESFEAWEEEV